jgi:hypothetical protein
MFCPSLAYTLAVLRFADVLPRLLRHRRKDDGEAEDEPGQRNEFGEFITIRPHVLPSEAFLSRC